LDSNLGQRWTMTKKTVLRLFITIGDLINLCSETCLLIPVIKLIKVGPFVCVEVSGDQEQLIHRQLKQRERESEKESY